MLKKWQWKDWMISDYKIKNKKKIVVERNNKTWVSPIKKTPPHIRLCLLVIKASDPWLRDISYSSTLNSVQLQRAPHQKSLSFLQ